MAGSRTLNQKWQLALVICHFAVKTPSTLQTFHPDQVIEVPAEKMRELSRKGLAYPLLFSPDQAGRFDIRIITPAYHSHNLN